MCCNAIHDFHAFLAILTENSLLPNKSNHTIESSNIFEYNSFNSAKSTNVDDSSASNLKFRIYSPSNKLVKNYSLSTNDLTPKTLTLPPVFANNNKLLSANASSSNENSSLLLGGSSTNLNSVSLDDKVNKKKIRDLSRYCYFCQRKTGLASSYICR